MVQNYIQYPQNQSNQFQTLKPNIKKIFLKNLFTVAGAILLIAIILLVVHFVVGLGIFMAIFETFGINIKPFTIFLYSFSVIIGISIFLLLGNYLVTGNLRYEFYQNKLIAYENALLVFINSKDIPYQNIVRVSYNNDGFFNTIFNSGTIVLELTGMKENKIELEFIDDIERTVQYIQNLIRESISTQQAQFTENYRIGNILNRGY